MNQKSSGRAAQRILLQFISSLKHVIDFKNFNYEIRIHSYTLKSFIMQKTQQILNISNRKLEKKHFLISLVEDNQMYLRAISQYIKFNIPNTKVSSFSRSSSFLKSLRHNPEIAIIDFNLDERSEIEGIELIRELKYKSPKTKIIVLTGEKSVSTAVKCLNEGVMNYVVKEDKAAEKVAEEIKKIMEEMLEEIKQKSKRRKINALLLAAVLAGLGFAFVKNFLPHLS